MGPLPSDAATLQTQMQSRPFAPAVSPPADERFLPGTVLARRYRIVNLLGRGGMGEVYRATDLMLGQPIALKFLPETASQQIQARERLSNEVRTAREITHPYVCRVHDIGEIDGQLYISMEFVDGEDLASLLSRIGRLPPAKASELAAGICAGLAAAHRKGLIHRDLKPANIMVDGRGQPRLMDFGLAASVGHIAQAEVRHGTPLYMAPEQLAGQEVTIRSDLYALGLILYELFTGRRPYEADTIEALRAARNSSALPPPSALCSEIDPAVENIITACLAPDPARRPASANAVAAALPHQSALAAVVAAGDTPSPELIAASGDTDALRPAQAYGWAALILAALLGAYFLKAQIGVVPEQSPDVLANSARALASQLGYSAKPAATVSWFDSRTAGEPPEIQFWYREGDTTLQASSLGDFLRPPGRVTSSDPPLAPGKLSIEMDSRGRLRYFAAIPRSRSASSSPGWQALFESAGLDFSRFIQAPADRLPPVPADTFLQWTGRSSPSDPQQTVAAASWAGQPVYFERIDPSPPGAELPIQRRPVLAVMALLLGMGAIRLFLLAWRNLQQQRGDRKGAFRVGAAVFWISLGQWLLVARHSMSLTEASLAAYALSWALFLGGLTYVGYVAVDPLVRRYYPHLLISLQQVLTGARRDTRLGRDILWGLIIAAAINLLQTAVMVGERIHHSSGFTLRDLAALWLSDVRLGVWVGLVAGVFVIPLRSRIKRRLRVGAVAIIVAETGMFCLKDLPAVPDASAWYAQAPLLGYGVLAAVAIYAARLSARPA